MIEVLLYYLAGDADLVYPGGGEAHAAVRGAVLGGGARGARALRPVALARRRLQVRQRLLQLVRLPLVVLLLHSVTAAVT